VNTLVWLPSIWLVPVSSEAAGAFSELEDDELRLPHIKGRLADVMMGTHLRRRHSRFLLLQVRTDLLFVEFSSHHLVRVLGIGLYQNADTFHGITPHPS
jgi:hypothetical protein